MSKLKELEKKLDKVKESKIQNDDYHQKPAVNYSIAINISIELITGIGLGVFLGLMLDNYLQTKPIMFIIFFIVGTIIGFYNMFKCLKRYGFFNN